MSKSFLKGAAFGALIASVTTLFFAPQTGKKTQKTVKKLVDSLSKDLLKHSRGLNTMSRQKYEDMVVSSIKNISKNSEMGKEYLEDVTTALKDRWEEFKKELDIKEIPDRVVKGKTSPRTTTKKNVASKTKKK